MGGGPSAAQNRAADAQAVMSGQLGQAFNRQQDFAEKQQGYANPFFRSRMDNGLPYAPAMFDMQGGLLAKAYQPARAALAKRIGAFGGNLPSGFAQQAMTNLDTQQARDFDAGMLGSLQEQEAAKRFGAGGITGQQQLANPLGYGSAAMQGNSSIMNAPLASPGVGGLIGGLASGAISKIPF